MEWEILSLLEFSCYTVDKILWLKKTLPSESNILRDTQICTLVWAQNPETLIGIALTEEVICFHFHHYFSYFLDHLIQINRMTPTFRRIMFEVAHNILSFSFKHFQ